jgi:thiamine-phosphate pyrophosphorylase
VNLPPLYAILDLELTRARGLEPLDVIDAWLDAGVRLVQLRAKALPSDALLELSERVARRVQAAGGTFIVNDRADVARMAGADGVHVGQTDLAPIDVRRLVGPTVHVGLSTHAGAQVEAAMLQPVSYIAIGPVFATQTKGVTGDLPVGLAGVRQAAGRAGAAGLPVVAIGGITLATSPDVLAAGATSVAVISDLLLGDPRDRAREYLSALRI